MHHQKNWAWGHSLQDVCDVKGSVYTGHDKRESPDPSKVIAKQVKTLRDWNALDFLWWEKHWSGPKDEPKEKQMVTQGTQMPTKQSSKTSSY